jgi:uncharacterized protein YacL
MIVYITRFVFVIAGAIGGFATSNVVDWPAQTGFSQNLVIFIFVILGSSLGYVLGGISGRELKRLWTRAENRLREVAPTDLLLGTVGLIVGLLVALLVSVPLRLLRPSWVAVTSSILLFVMLAYAGVRVALLKRHDFAKLFPRLDGDPAGSAADSSAKVLILDTSAIIDARFVEISRLGFLNGSLRVPRFVLAELHTLADSADDTKRARGRRGLDLLETLPGAGLSVEVFEADYPDTPTVDGKLVRLASQLGAVLVTVDYNLAKVARVQGIEVLNINELAAGLRPAFLPGETLRVRVIREGKEADQGVGYLEDGTMVVVQHGRSLIGAEADTEVTSVLQTSAGRMIFTRAAGVQDGAGS